MHILFAVPGYKPAYRIGGPIHSVSAKAEILVRKGHRVTVFTTNSNLDEDLDVETDKPLDVDGVEVWYFKREAPLKKYLPFLRCFSKSVGFVYAPQMRSALDSLMPQVDVVHTHLPFIYPTYAAGKAAIRHGVPLVYHQRGVLDPARLKFRSLKKQLYIRFREMQLLKEASCLISLTDAETASYRALGVDTRCEVIPNGVHVEEYWQETPQEWLDKLRIPGDAQVVLFMGRLHPIKGADRLVEAFLRIRKQFPKAILVCAGPDEFGIQDQLGSMINGEDTAQSRVLFPGMVSGDYKKALLARADLFCLPSDAEGFSMAVLEAMASRTAVLLSPRCHFGEVVSAGAGMVAPKDADSVAAALSELLADGDALKAMGNAAFDLVSRDYTWEPLVDKLIAVYERCIRERNSRCRS